MNAKKLIVSLSMLAAAGSVFAQANEINRPDEGFVPAKSRAEGQAELAAAVADGSYAQARKSVSPLAYSSIGSRDRAEVKAELAAAVADGSYAQARKSVSPLSYSNAVKPAVERTLISGQGQANGS